VGRQWAFTAANKASCVEECEGPQTSQIHMHSNKSTNARSANKKMRQKTEDNNKEVQYKPNKQTTNKQAQRKHKTSSLEGVVFL
jgi:hypothetical protein